MAETNAAMGHRLRELRMRRGLQQSEVARRLQISPAYLSLIVKGKRVVQLPLLFQALELYGVAVEDFMRSLGERRVDDGLARLLDEPLLRSLNLSEQDLQSISAEPRMVTTITALFNLYKNTRSQLDHVLAGIAQRERQTDDDSLRFDYSPFDEVTDFLERNDNWFETLEERAQQFRRDGAFGRRVTSADLEQALLEQMGVRIHRIPERDDSSVIRTWNPAERILTISNDLFEQRLKFQLAHTVALALFDEEKLHEPIIEDYTGQHAETRKLLKIHLANYFAGALLLPYPEFYREVTSTRYDVELLAQLFESSYETVAHRMCNLSDPRRRGVPMHFLRVDVAGNISKRYSGDGIRFPHQDGSCPKMAVHLAFLTPSVITKQYSAFPDGSTYFCFAKVVSDPHQGSLVKGTTYSIGLGTHADNAKYFAYADDMPFADPKKMAVPVGTTCRFCERTDCNMRSAPSYKFAFRVDEYTKKDNFFSPLVNADSGAEGQKASRRKSTA
jgi:predicted transcriptional regulator/DNA-binding XRE family transcriptional regulator